MFTVDVSSYAKLAKENDSRADSSKSSVLADGSVSKVDLVIDSKAVDHIIEADMDSDSRKDTTSTASRNED